MANVEGERSGEIEELLQPRGGINFEIEDVGPEFWLDECDLAPFLAYAGTGKNGELRLAQIPEVVGRRADIASVNKDLFEDCGGDMFYRQRLWGRGWRLFRFLERRWCCRARGKGGKGSNRFGRSRHCHNEAAEDDLLSERHG